MTAKPELLREETIAEMAEIMRVLAHETRLRLLDTLRTEGEISVGALEALTRVGQPGLSQQLAILRKAGLVSARKAAKQVYYSLASQPVRRIVMTLVPFTGIAATAEKAREALAPQPAHGSAARFAKIL